MSSIWIFVLVFLSLMLTALCYFPNLQLTFAQTNVNSSGNFSDLFSGDRFTNIEYPSSWDRFEIPELNGVLYLSPLKTVGVIVQVMTEKDIIPDELYTDLILLMRQNLDDLNILSTNSTKNLIGSDIETLEYSFGSDSKKFKIQQTMEVGKHQVYLFTFFAENIFYDRFIPIVSTMKNTFFYLNENENPIVKQPISETNSIIPNLTLSEIMALAENIFYDRSTIANLTLSEIMALAENTENIFYDRFIPIVSTMKNTFFNSNENENPIVKQPISETNSIIPNQTLPEIIGNDNRDLEITNQAAQMTQNADRNLMYTNPYLGITLEYPSSLIKNEGDDGVSFSLGQGTSGIIVGVIPSVHDSLKNFTSEHISDFESNLKNFHLTDMSQLNLFSEPTQLLSFNYVNNSRLYEGIEYITMDGTDAYVFSYFSPANTFEKYLDLFSDIIESTELRNLPRIT